MAKRIIDHWYVMWAVQQRQSTFYYQCMRLHSVYTLKSIACNSAPLNYATLSIEKYYNGTVSWRRRILIYYTRFKAVFIFCERKTWPKYIDCHPQYAATSEMTIGWTTDDREDSEEAHVQVYGWCNEGSSITVICVRSTINIFGNYISSQMALLLRLVCDTFH